RKWSRMPAPRPSEPPSPVEPRQFPEVRLRVRERRQRPGAGAHGADIAIDGNFDQIRSVGLDCGFERAFEVPGAGDAGGLDSERTREHGEVRAVELAGLVFPEARRQLLAELAELHVSYRTVAVVVPHHPHGGNVVLHGGGENV